LRLFSFGGYGLALAALALVVFGVYDSYPTVSVALLAGHPAFHTPGSTSKSRGSQRPKRGGRAQI